MGCVAMALCACHSHIPDAVRIAARMPLQVLDELPSGTRVATLPRPTTRVVRVSLFIDAGSRDATPPTTAVLAGWLSAARGGEDPSAAGSGGPIQVAVYPDVTELSLPCTRDQLDRCLERLSRALTTRDPPESSVERARLRLRDDQRRSVARDPLQGADRLALEALLGEHGRNFFPLGTPSDETVPTAEQVARFLREHYGPSRALLVAAGDVDPTQVRELVAQRFGHTAAGVLPRVARDLRPSDEPRLLVAFDAENIVAIAIAGRDEVQLNNVVTSLRVALSQSEPRIELTGHIFDTRGGAIALLRARCTDSDLALDRVTRELLRLKAEPPEAAPRNVLPDDLSGSARRFGLSFGATSKLVLRDFQFGIGLFLDAGQSAGPRGQKSEADTQRSRSEHARAVFERASELALPSLKGAIDEYGAAVVADNGPHIDVQFAQGADVGIAVRVANGSQQDPPLMHGRAALLTVLTESACAGMSPALLHHQLEQLGAALEAHVDPESYGLLLRVPKQHWQRGLDLATRCMRAPSHDASDLAEATLRLQNRLRAQRGALAYRARAAALITPRAPGELAAWGDPGQIGNITPRDVDAAIAQQNNGVRWAVGIVGPVPVKQAAQRAARRLADLPSGAQPNRIASSTKPPPGQTLGPRATNATGISTVVVWSTTGKFEQPLGARLFARAMGALLGAVPGIEVVWYDGDTRGELSFAAVALNLRPDVATQLPQLLSSAAQGLDEAFIDKALPEAVARASAEQTGADAQLVVRADRVARARLGASLAAPNTEETERLLRALRTSQPRWAP